MRRGHLTQTGSAFDRRVAQWTQRSMIRSVQRGAITMTPGNASATATITAVDVNASTVIWLGNAYGGSETNNARTRARITLTNETTVTATRSDGGGANNLVVQFEVRQYWPGVIRTVQRDTSANGTKAITAVDVSRATIDFLGWSTAQTDGDCGASVTLTDSTTATVSATGSSTTAGFQVTWWA